MPLDSMSELCLRASSSISSRAANLARIGESLCPLTAAAGRETFRSMPGSKRGVLAKALQEPCSPNRGHLCRQQESAMHQALQAPAPFLSPKPRWFPRCNQFPWSNHQRTTSSAQLLGEDGHHASSWDACHVASSMPGIYGTSSSQKTGTNSFSIACNSVTPSGWPPTLADVLHTVPRQGSEPQARSARLPPGP